MRRLGFSSSRSLLWRALYRSRSRRCRCRAKRVMVHETSVASLIKAITRSVRVTALNGTTGSPYTRSLALELKRILLDLWTVYGQGEYLYARVLHGPDRDS